MDSHWRETASMVAGCKEADRSHTESRQCCAHRSTGRETVMCHKHWHVRDTHTYRVFSAQREVVLLLSTSQHTAEPTHRDTYV